MKTDAVPSMLEALLEEGRRQGWPRASWQKFRMEEGGGSGSGEGGSEGGAGGEGGSGSGAGGEGGSGEGSEPAFPANTPVVEMTPVQQAAYWKAQSRKHEGRADARKDYDDLKKKAEEHDRLLASTQTENERALETAKKEAADAERAKVTGETATKLVTAEMRIAAAGRIEPDRLKSLLEPLDLSKFLTAEGEVDETKVTEYVASIAPVKGADDGRKPFPKLGQGRQAPAGTATPARGAERFAQRHPAKAS